MSQPGQQVILQCGICQRSRLNLGKLDVNSLSRAELWGTLVQPAHEHGWSIRIDGQKRDAVCPACIAAQRSENFPPYSGSNAICPKCLTSKPKTAFCRGNLAGCKNGGSEHLHRLCMTCGFDWPETPADQQRGWLKRLLGR